MLKGKIFTNRKNEERKALVENQQTALNGSEVVTIKFLNGKNEGTSKDMLLSSFKKSWKETEEVIEEVVEEPEQVEEVVDTEENLSDEDYAKIGVEIAEEAEKRANNITNKEKTLVLLEHIKSELGKKYTIKPYSTNPNYLVIKTLEDKSRRLGEVDILKNHITVYSKNDSEIECIAKKYVNKTLGYSYKLSYSCDYMNAINKIFN